MFQCGLFFRHIIIPVIFYSLYFKCEFLLNKSNQQQRSCNNTSFIRLLKLHTDKARRPYQHLLHIRVELELVSLVSNCKVALGNPVPASLKGHLVASQPALVAHHCCAVDGCAVDVVVNVTANIDVFALVARLELSALFAARRLQGKKIQVDIVVSQHETENCSDSEKKKNWFITNQVS